MKIRIGSRGSTLALTQSEMVKTHLLKAHNNLEVEIVPIKTLGDKKQGTPAAENGDKKDWILELEKAVAQKEIDIAVHSGKDVPCDLEPQTEITSLLARATPFDLFIGQKTTDSQTLAFKDLPEGAVIGTASLRRQAQLILYRSDLRVVPHRGNVPTRVRKLHEKSELSGIVLAAAGIERLGEDIAAEQLKTPHFLPAVNQGILCAQFHSDRAEIKELLSPLIDKSTQAVFTAERQAVTVLQGDCKSAISSFAECRGDSIELTARVMTPDGIKHIESHATGSIDEAFHIGDIVGNELLKQGAADLIEESRKLA